MECVPRMERYGKRIKQFLSGYNTWEA